MSFIQYKIKELLYVSIIFIFFGLIYTLLIFFKVIDANYSSIRTITYIAGGVIFFIYGLISGKLEKQNGWLAGLSSSLLLLIIVFIINLFCHTPINLLFLGKLLSYLLCGMAGGIIGVNIKNKHLR